MGNRYGRGYEPWTLEAGDSGLTVRPRKGDTSNFLKLVKGVDKENTDLYGIFGSFIEEMMRRDHPPKNDEEVIDLEEYVESNIVKLVEEVPVALKISSKEEMAKAKAEEEALKKKPN